MIRAISRLALAFGLVAAPSVLAAQAKPAARAGNGEEGRVLLTVRGGGVRTADKSSAVPLLGLSADRISTSDEFNVEIDAAYFVTSKIALAVSASLPSTNDLLFNGAKLGDYKQTTVTARAQYHFQVRDRIRPYLGAGVQMISLYDVDLAARDLGRFDLGSPVFGPVGQLGLNIKLARRVFLNGDVRYSLAYTNLEAGVNKVSKLELNPLAFGGGLSVRF